MQLLLLVIITTLYLAFAPPVQSALVQRYESAPLKSNIINKRDDDDDDDDHKGGSNEFHWGYRGKTGPDHWAKHYPICGGRRQSPIDLYKGDRVTTWSPFQFYNYNVNPASVKVMNNGHSAMITMDMPNSRPYVRGGNLNGDYEFAQLHFHWGSNNSVGSEHVINHNRYPCEAHLVHYRKIYNDTATAVLYEDGLAVFGVMFTIVEDSNPLLAGFITGLANITHADQEVTIQPFKLSAFLPYNRRKFYRYRGSLTTPSCNEVAVWTVFKDEVCISATQMAQFRTLKETSGHALVDNFRPVQPLGNRQLYFADLD